MLRDDLKGFYHWLHNGNVVELTKGIYTTKCHLWRNRIEGIKNLKKFYIREFVI